MRKQNIKLKHLVPIDIELTTQKACMYFYPKSGSKMICGFAKNKCTVDWGSPAIIENTLIGKPPFIEKQLDGIYNITRMIE